MGIIVILVRSKDGMKPAKNPAAMALRAIVFSVREFPSVLRVKILLA